MSRFRPAIPPTSVSLPPARRIIVVASDTESDGEGDYPNNDEESSIIENQAGYPLSIPQPASENVGHNESNRDNDGEFRLKQRCVQTESLVSRSSLWSSSQCRWSGRREQFYWHCIIIGQQGENKFIMITTIWPIKLFQEATKIEVHIKGSHRSDPPTININVEQLQVRGRKHEREVEDYEEKTQINVQIKKIRK